MISKKDIIEIAHPDVKGTKVIELSTLSELRQQLKDELSKEMRPYHVPILLKVVDEVLGVEGEK